MQRITLGDPIDEDDLNSYEQSLAVLCRHFPPLIATLYATARRGRDGYLEWWSAREGQPIPLAALPAPEQAMLQEKCRVRQDAIRHLAEELIRRGEPAQAERLQTLLSETPILACYGLNGEPVLVNWGIPRPLPVVVSAGVPLALTPPLPAPPRRGRLRHLGYLAALLLSLLIGLLLLHYWPMLAARLASPQPASEQYRELTKDVPSISLAKQRDFGRIRVNLHWTHSAADPAIDLDIGAFVRLKNQQQNGIEALSRLFGNYNNPPYVALAGDDRSGTSREGEWLLINGSHWQQIDEVLIYAFIYGGVSNWQSTNATITIHIPGQSPIETRLTEGRNDRPVGVIARLVNLDGTIKVERINQYFDDRKSIDKAFGWGFEWHSVKGKGKG